MKIIPNLDRRLSPANTTTERYLLVRVVAPDRSGPSNRLPLNLSLVVDRSGSMAGSKLQYARDAAIECLRNLTGADRAAVVSYDDEVRVVSPSRTLSPEVKTRLISEVRGIESGGSTNLSGGWLTGGQEVAAHMHEANYLSRVLLLTDGLANVGIIDPEELAHHATELRQRGVSTTTFGIGADYNEELLERMSINGGGHFYFIENPRQIRDLLHREFGEVLSTCARNVSLQIDTPEGVHARLLNNFEVAREGKRFKVRLDDMISGEVRPVVFALSVRPGKEGTVLPFTITVTYTDVESGEQRTIRSTEAVLMYASERECADEQERERANSEVMDEVALQRAALAREEALKYDAAGNRPASAAALAQAASYMRMAAPASPIVAAEADALEEEITQANEGLTALQRKAMHYKHNLRRQGRKE